MGKFRLIAGNIIRAEARYITPPFLKTRYAPVLARAAASSHVGVKYPFYFTKTWRWRPLTRSLKTRSTSHSSSLSTVTVKGTAEVIAAAFVGNLFSLISKPKNKRKRESSIERVQLRGNPNHDSQPPWSHDHGTFQKKRYMIKVLPKGPQPWQ